MSGGRISGNEASHRGNGGGVYVKGGTFTRSGGEISGNTARGGGDYNSWGGGVYVEDGRFTMSGGEISGNTASCYDSGDPRGGGVYVNGGRFGLDGRFTKTGSGIIYGYTSGDAKSNTVKNSSGVVRSGSGHAVYVSGSDPVKRRETTAGPTVNLDSSKSGSAGGWE
jgi:hypothetical protein